MSGSGPAARGVGGQVAPIAPLPGGTTAEAGFTQGVNVQFPNDPLLVPYLKLEQEQFGSPVEGAPTRVTADLLKQARLIPSPEERSLALQRIAKGAIESMQLTLAHQTLEEAAKTVDSITDPLVHDQRLIAIVTSLNTLTPVLLRAGLEEMPRRELDLGGPQRVSKAYGSLRLIVRMARLEWKRAAHLAANIGNPTYRNEMLYRVVESEASGSKAIADAFAKIARSADFVRQSARGGAGRRPAERKVPEARRRTPGRRVRHRQADRPAGLEVSGRWCRSRFRRRTLSNSPAASSWPCKSTTPSRRAEALLLLADPMCRRERSVNLKLEKPLPRDDRGNVTFRFPPRLANRIEFQGGGTRLDEVGRSAEAGTQGLHQQSRVRSTGRAFWTTGSTAGPWQSCTACTTPTRMQRRPSSRKPPRPPLRSRLADFAAS